MTTQHLLHQQLKTKQNFQMQENSAQEAMKRQPNEGKDKDNMFHLLQSRIKVKRHKLNLHNHVLPTHQHPLKLKPKILRIMNHMKVEPLYR